MSRRGLAVSRILADVIEAQREAPEPGDWGPAERAVAALGLLSETEIRQVCGALRDAGLLNDPEGA